MAASCIESVNASLLIQPKSKKHSFFPKRYPFPIFRDTDVENSNTWNCIIGHLKEYSVVVSDEENMELLFSMGFFGKGTLSRSTPQALENKFGGRKRKSWSKSKRRHDVQSTDSTDHCERNDETPENPAKRQKQDEIEVVLSDTNDSTEEESNSSSDSITVTISKDDQTISKPTEKEVLQLSLEEAFFLSYGLGVLVVKDKDQPLDLMRLWHKFCEIHPNKNFPVMYTAYHHFRSKGWIVKSGLKYGTDFALYKDGPPFYHSSYTVIVKPVKEQNLRDISLGGRPNLTWSSLAGLNRMVTHVSKALVILYVIKPTSISENKISTPYCVSQYKLEEVLVHRWVPSEDRSED